MLPLSFWSLNVTDAELPLEVTKNCTMGAVASPLFFPSKTDDLFLLTTISPFLFHSGVIPPEWSHPALFLLVPPHLSTVLCKFTRTRFLFVRMWPPGGCHPGRSALTRSLVTPLDGGGLYGASSPRRLGHLGVGCLRNRILVAGMKYRSRPFSLTSVSDLNHNVSFTSLISGPANMVLFVQIDVYCLFSH